MSSREQDDFCKVFKIPGIGQVLVKFDVDEDHAPELRVYTKPQGLGVCSAAFGFPDSDEGWDKAEGSFAEMDEERAGNIARSICEMSEDAPDFQEGDL